jgi:hypothetical protein
MRRVDRQHILGFYVENKSGPESGQLARFLTRRRGDLRLLGVRSSHFRYVSAVSDRLSCVVTCELSERTVWTRTRRRLRTSRRRMSGAIDRRGVSDRRPGGWQISRWRTSRSVGKPYESTRYSCHALVRSNGDETCGRCYWRGLVTLTLMALSGAPARADCEQVENDLPSSARLGRHGDNTTRSRTAPSGSSIGPPELDADADQGGGRSKRHRVARGCAGAFQRAFRTSSGALISSTRRIGALNLSKSYRGV